MAPKRNNIGGEEIDVLLKVEITFPATPTWSFPVVIATKKDMKARFYMDYRMLNQKMKTDHFPLPKIQKIFEELARG